MRRPVHSMPLFAVLLALAAPSAFAQAAAPQGVLNLAASASLEVPRDLLSITFSTTRDGSDAGAVQAQLKQALDAALVEAKKAARPGQVDVQTGNFALTPRYASKGGISGWQGSAELVVEGRDLQAISQLAGRISTLTVGRVGYSLSREVREKAEADVSAQAIARYRAKAADYARLFGYAGYAIREISVNANEAPPLRPMQLQARAMSASADEALPVEAGKAAVTVNVSGTIQLK
ncbi:MAG TPA: SIMPL domain-containing protein [Caldimonas sp.]